MEGGSPFGFGISPLWTYLHAGWIEAMHTLVLQKVPKYAIYRILAFNKPDHSKGITIGVSTMGIIVALKWFDYCWKLVPILTSYHATAAGSTLAYIINIS